MQKVKKEASFVTRINYYKREKFELLKKNFKKFKRFLNIYNKLYFHC